MNKFIERVRKIVKNESLYEFFSFIAYKRIKHKNNKIKDVNTIKRNIEKFYYSIFKKKIDFDNPVTFNEKLNWMKVFWEDTRAFACVDKYLVRDYVREKGLSFLLNDLYFVFDNPDDIKIDELPEKFVLKSTHDSGMHLIICNGNKKSINWKIQKKKMKRWLSIDYCYAGGEWPYHTKKPRIICEKFLEDPDNSELLDYKFFCFHGEPKLVFLASNRKEEVKSDFYDLEWKKMPFRWEYEPSNKLFSKPMNFDKMIEYARVLASDFPFVRVDFYDIKGKIVFGELTFFHGGGLGRFFPDDIDYELGKLIDLPEKKNPWGNILREK